MSSQMISLKTATTFRRNSPNGPQVLVLQPGERVKYVRTETETLVVHTATTLRDGFVWTSVKTTPKQPTAPTTDTRLEMKAMYAQAEAKQEQAAYEAKMARDKACEMAQVQPRTEKTAEATQRGALSAASKDAAQQIEGVDAMERAVDHRQKMIDALQGDLWRVNYYIPTVLQGEVEHPSTVFHRHAIRLDGSNWVFTDKGLKHPEVQAMFRKLEQVQPRQIRTAAGYVRTVAIECWVEKYHPDDVATALKRAQTALHNHLIDVHTSLIERIANAAERLKEAQDKLTPEATEQQRERPLEAHYGALRGALRDATEAFQAALLAAEAFDERANLSDLFDGVRAALRAEAAAANVTLRDAKRRLITLPASIA